VFDEEHADAPRINTPQGAYLLTKPKFATYQLMSMPPRVFVGIETPLSLFTITWGLCLGKALFYVKDRDRPAGGAALRGLCFLVPGCADADCPCLHQPTSRFQKSVSYYIESLPKIPKLR
jgi:hypothetical protein